jgi:HEAT repeat protein
MMRKVAPMIKPFMPQLQRTFVKSLSDPSPIVRQRAASALGIFIALQPNIDPLVRDLEKGIMEEGEETKETMLNALWQIFDKTQTGKGVSDLIKKTVETVVFEPALWQDGHDGVRESASLVLATYISAVQGTDKILK